MADADKKKKSKRPTAEKREITSKKKRDINKQHKSKMRTAIRNFEDSLEKSKEEAAEKLKLVYSLIDKSVKRNLIKINAGSRKKSRLTAALAAK